MGNDSIAVVTRAGQEIGRAAAHRMSSRAAAFAGLVRAYQRPLVSVHGRDARGPDDLPDQVVEFVVRMVLSVPVLDGALTATDIQPSSSSAS